ncbi:MAG: penicillin-binding protein 2 [Armatimonadetes bacterium]|nr:penicillin-binding protein 2 [Armatimonadota bacterium]
MKSAEAVRYRAVGWCFVGAFVVAGYSQAKLQVVDRQRVLDVADRIAHFDQDKVEVPRRGSVLSSDGKVLAQTEDESELGLNYEKIPSSPAFFMELSSATGIPATELSVRPPKRNGRVWRTPLTADQARAVRKVRREWSADGVSLESAKGRDYPLLDACSGLVGAVRDGVAIAGLEKSQDSRLKGVEGESRGFIDRTGAFVPDKDARNRPKQNGADIVLTIDSGLQIAAVQSLRAAVEANKAKSGCVIAMDQKTGDILAMANWPSFDPTGSWKPGDDFNMASMGAYEPGSTFKILTLAKGLDSGAVRSGDHYQCSGQIQVGDRTIHCADHHGSRAHGDVDLERAIGKSCNVAAANWALKVGHDEFVRFMDSMGLFEKTDLGLPSERKGQFNRKDYAKRVQTATNGFGQSMNCVPVNLAAAYCMIANGGKMMVPRLIRKLGNEEVPVKERGQIVKSEVAQEVMKMMESVIESDFGTGKKLKVAGYKLAGKTGTAQKVGTAKGKYVANFVGMVPSSDPRAVVLVMIDCPSAGKYYGGEVAGPVFVDMAKAVIRRFGIPPTEGHGR